MGLGDYFVKNLDLFRTQFFPLFCSFLPAEMHLQIDQNYAIKMPSDNCHIPIKNKNDAKINVILC